MGTMIFYKDMSHKIDLKMEIFTELLHLRQGFFSASTAHRAIT